MSISVADSSFASLLDEFGPHASDRPVTLEEARRHTRSLAGGHYENFPVLSCVLPRRLRQDFANVYAFCRWADDLGDEVRSVDESLSLLQWWQSETDACFDGSAWHPVFVALRETIRQHTIQKQEFDDLIDAFRQDQVKTRYETFEELRDYCRRSADPVGRIVLRLCRRHSPENVNLSDSVCTGLQLINFWQDVARDFAIGRVYLPREDRVCFGYADEDLAARQTTEAFRRLIAFEVQRARTMLREGIRLADEMPGRLKAVIALFALGGLRMCDRVDGVQGRVWDVRPTLSRGDVVRLTATALGRVVTAPLRRRK